MRISSLLSVACWTSLIASSAIAAPLVDNGNVTYDPNTGLEWLDWTESVNRTYNDVSAQFGVGGDFEGWRYASIEEVTTLFTNHGLEHINDYVPNPVQQVADLVQLLGDTVYPVHELSASVAMMLKPEPGITVYVASLDVDPVFFEPGTAITEDNTIEDEFSDQQIGHALVRYAQPSVPEPSSFALLAVGLLGIGGYVTRKRRG